jgi:DNA-binding transcriptional regulator YiaG
MKKKYQSEQLMVCHQDAEALYQIGAITEAQMREFDKECLVPEPASKASGNRQAAVPASTNSSHIFLESSV